MNFSLIFQKMFTKARNRSNYTEDGFYLSCGEGRDVMARHMTRWIYDAMEWRVAEHRMFAYDAFNIVDLW